MLDRHPIEQDTDEDNSSGRDSSDDEYYDEDGFVKATSLGAPDIAKQNWWYQAYSQRGGAFADVPNAKVHTMNDVKLVFNTADDLLFKQTVAGIQQAAKVLEELLRKTPSLVTPKEAFVACG